MSNVWRGDPDALAAFAWIEPTGYTSPRKPPKQRKKPDNTATTDKIRIYFNNRGYGFTVAGTYFHVADIVEGEPQEGAAIQYTTVETPKGIRAKNVYVGVGGVS